MDYNSEELKFIDFINYVEGKKIFQIELNPIELRQIAKLSYYETEDLLENLKHENIIEKYFFRSF